MSFSFLPTNKKVTIFSDERTGFTMIEMLVSIGIFVLITSAFMVSMRAFEQSSSLNSSAQELAAHIIEIRNQTWAGLTTTLCGGGSVVPEGGYGVYVSTTGGGITYKTFADCNGDFQFTGSPDETVRTVVLDNNLAITAIQDEGGGNFAGNGAHITFRPPTNNTFLYSDGAAPSTDATKAVVTLEHTPTGKTKTVTVLRFTSQLLIE